MLPFFRKIRFRLAKDNQFLKYTRYAIGEIVLVVIGILIALYINNWNEERKTEQLTKVLFEEIQSDILISLNEIRTANETHNFQFLWIRRILLDQVNRSDYEETYGLPYVIMFSPQPNFKNNGYEKLVRSVIEIPDKYRDLFDKLTELFKRLENSQESYRAIGELAYSNNDKIASSQEWYSDENWQSDSAIDYFLNSKEYKNLVRKFNFAIDAANLFDDMYLLIESYLMLAEITEINQLPKEFHHLMNQNLDEFTGVYQWKDPVERERAGDRLVTKGDGYLNYPGNEPFYQIAKDSFVTKYNNTLIFRRDSLSNIVGATRIFVGEPSELEKID